MLEVALRGRLDRGVHPERGNPREFSDGVVCEGREGEKYTGARWSLRWVVENSGVVRRRAGCRLWHLQ